MRCRVPVPIASLNRPDPRSGNSNPRAEIANVTVSLSARARELEEIMRKEMDVGVTDGDFAPRRLHWISATAVGRPGWPETASVPQKRKLSETSHVIDSELLHHGLPIASNSLKTQVQHDRDFFARFPSATRRRTCSSLGDRPSRADGTCFDSRSPRWIRCSSRSETCGLR